MERMHRIFSNINPKLKAFLDRQAIPHEYNESFAGKTILLAIPESHPKWPGLKVYIEDSDVYQTVELEFSQCEILAAAYSSPVSSRAFR